MTALTQVTLSIASMSCASCVERVDHALAAAASVAGYPATVTQGAGTGDRAAPKEEEARYLARRTLLAAVLALPVFAMEMGSHVIPAVHDLIRDGIGIQTS